MTLNRYAITPNGPKIDATIEEKENIDSIYEGDGYTKSEDLRIVAWDENASTLTFAIEKITEKWDQVAQKYAGMDYEFVSEPYTVNLTKD